MAQIGAGGKESKRLSAVGRIASSIGTKIILPYLLLTLSVAGVGAFVVTNLVTGTLLERLNNQLLDSGRVVAEGLVASERERLEVLRLISFSEGVPEAIADFDQRALAATIPQIATNGLADTVILLDATGREIYSWSRSSKLPSGQLTYRADYSQLVDVRKVLSGHEDQFGDKLVTIVQTPYGDAIYAIGPIRRDDQLVGAVLVGNYAQDLVVDLTELAIARVTLHDRKGHAVGTTLGLSRSTGEAAVWDSKELYDRVIMTLQETSPPYDLVVASSADSRVPLRQVTVLNQDYQLAYGEWQMRGQSFGLFSVALPTNFIVSAAVTSRTTFSIVFSLATLAVFTLGYFVARLITRPIHRLVQTSNAIAAGQLEQRTGIDSRDEIGALARSFDLMTANLAERSRRLAEQAGELEAILQSIADGVIVFDKDARIIASNVAAQRILPHLLRNGTYGSNSANPPGAANDDPLGINELLSLDATPNSRRFKIGGRVFSGLAASITTGEGCQTGRVVVLRDVTREAEVEELKDGFISSVSHELRTPLTTIKGFVELLLVSSSNGLGEKQLQFAKVVNSNTDKMIEHVNKLIDIAEIQNGTLQLRKQEELFSRMVRETVESWSAKMEIKGLTLTQNIVDPDLWVYGDTVRLVWAIDNLLRNAHAYTPGGGSVEVRAYQLGDKACFEVRDSGIGIDPADQPHLFSRFFRIQNEYTFNIPGIGLDLYITRSIIETHGGRIWVESKPGMGSTFSFVIPLVERPEKLLRHQ